MQGNRARDTSPELSFRNALWKAGLRGYRKNPKGFAGRPDIVFTKHKLAVFVHGCFWHRCPKCCPTSPKTNALFWSEKFRANVERDQRNQQALEQLGFLVLTVWECELKEGIEAQVERIRETLAAAASPRS